MGISQYFQALAYTAAMTASGGALAVEPLQLLHAADYLVQRGMNKEAARSFVRAASDSDQVRILTSNNIGQVIMSLRLAGVEKGPAFAEAARTVMFTQRDSVNGPYAIPLEDPAVRQFLQADCLVKTADDPFSAKDVMGQMLQSPSGTIEQALFSDDELAAALIGHEASHCPRRNGDAHKTMKEVDADQHLAELPVHKPMQADTATKLALVRAMSDMCNRTGFVPTAHSTGLFLDAKAVQGKNLTWEEVSPVYGELLPLLKAFRDAQGKDKMNAVPCFVATGAAYKTFLDADAAQFKPLTRHYMNMTIKGVEMVAPQALKAAIESFRKPTHVTSLGQ